MDDDRADPRTPRDIVWANMLRQRHRFRIEDLMDSINEEDRPSRETVQRTLRAATMLRILDHERGSRTYRVRSLDMIRGPPSIE